MIGGGLCSSEENFVHKRCARSFVGKCLLAYSNYDLFCAKCAWTSPLAAAWEIKMFATGDGVIRDVSRAPVHIWENCEVAWVVAMGDRGSEGGKTHQASPLAAPRYWIGGARGFPAFECSSKFTYYAVGSAIRWTYKQQTTCKRCFERRRVTFHHCIWPGGCDVFIQRHVSHGEILRARFSLTCPGLPKIKVCLLFQWK